MQVKGALRFPIINTPVPPPLRPQRLTPLPSPSLTPWPPFPSTLQHPIMSCNDWMKRDCSQPLCICMCKRKSKWNEPKARRSGVWGLRAKGARRTQYIDCSQPLYLRANKRKSKWNKCKACKGGGLGCEQSEQEEYSPPPTQSVFCFALASSSLPILPRL